jgi:hypothetical protein
MLGNFNMKRLIQIKQLFQVDGITPEMMKVDVDDPDFVALNMPFNLFKEIECVRLHWDLIPCGEE